MGKERRNGSENFGGDLLLGAYGRARFVEALNGAPVGTTGELVIHGSSIFEMAEAGFLDVCFFDSVGAGGFAADEDLCLARVDLEIQDHRLARKLVNVVFEVFDPGDERLALCGWNTRGLVRQIRGNIAVGQDDSALGESGLEFGFCFEAIAGIKQGSEVWVDGLESTEVAVEELADHSAEPIVVLRKTGGVNGLAGGDEGFFEEFNLGTFAAAVDTFDGDEFSGCSHICRPV